ncbi:MAG: glycosyltransferase family 4 protein [Myxococcota bacterium]
MKVAYLTPQYPKVSHTFIRREIKALEEMGHEVTRISIRKSDAGVVVDEADIAELSRTHILLGSKSEMVRGFFSALMESPLDLLGVLFGAMARGLDTGSGLIRPIAYVMEAVALINLCREQGVQHVHVHFATNAATVAWIARRLGGPTYSQTIHGPDEWDGPVRHWLASKIEDSAFTAVISSYARAQALRWIGAEHGARLHEVHCTVDDAFFDAAVPIKDDQPMQFVSVGRLTPQKGPLVLLEAFSRLLESGVKANLVMAGDGELREIVDARIKALGLEEHVRITGWVDEATVRSLLNESRCFVLPSFAEGLPVVIMEALALQRPVLSTYVAGIPELVRPGENGWLVPAGDVAQLTEALKRVVETPASELREMGAAGADRVRAEHSVATEAAKIDKLLRALPSEGSN